MWSNLGKQIQPTDPSFFSAMLPETHTQKWPQSNKVDAK